MTTDRCAPLLSALLLGLLLPALPGCPRTDTTYCLPGDEQDGCLGTEHEDLVTDQTLPDGDGTCPVGTYLFCPEGADCSQPDSTAVMEAACEHAFDHDWTDCQVRYLCGPVEDIEGCCYLVEVDGNVEG